MIYIYNKNNKILIIPFSYIIIFTIMPLDLRLFQIKNSLIYMNIFLR